MKRQKPTTRRLRLSRRARRDLLIGIVVICGIFVLGNGILGLVYKDKTYPKTQIMQTKLGNVAFADLARQLDSGQLLLPDSITFRYQDKKITLPSSELGLRKDTERSLASARSERSWLPVVNLFKAPTLAAPAAIDQTVLAINTKAINTALQKESKNAQLALSGITVKIETATDGYRVDDKKLAATILGALDQGKEFVQTPIIITKPTVSASALESKKQALEAQLNTPLQYSYNGKLKAISKTDIAGWYTVGGDSFAPQADKVEAQILQLGRDFGIRVKDSKQVATATIDALSKNQALNMVLVHQTALKTYTYCVAARGVDTTYLPALQTKLRSAYGEAQGWSLNGDLEFKAVSSGCNFTVWLTAADMMPTFGAICDALWSCRVGPNVVINFDRWQNASPAWNSNGGTLEEYRNMVINHETGHWLSFGHASCAGPGQLAPVMQQQSIDLQGCTFNAWPTAGERSALRRVLGL